MAEDPGASEEFYEKAVTRNFEKLTRKNLCRRFSFLKLDGLDLELH